MLGNQSMKTCSICSQDREDGISLLWGFICVDCEMEMIQTDALDERYLFFIHRLKEIWYKLDA